MIAWLKNLWARLLRWLMPQDQPVTLTVPPIPIPDVDWFVWESEQIQKGGYAPWFDHWRYEGEPFAYPDPTAEQRAKVFRMSEAKALRTMRVEVLRDIEELVTADLAKQGIDTQHLYKRVMLMGQDPVQWSINYAREKNLLN